MKLGNPNGAEALRRAGKGGAPLREAIAAMPPARTGPGAGGGGHPGRRGLLEAIAAELNGRGMLTRRAGRWHASTVTNLLDRLGLREATWAGPG